MIKKLYPYGKEKVFNVTYDDGVLQDVRFVELLNKYKLKGTFNLNSGLIKNEFEWLHEKGFVVKRLSKEKVFDLYTGHEIASHTLTHPFMQDKTESEILYELKEDKKNLENIFNQKIKGFAVPFDYYSDLIEACAKKSGFEYARISEESLSFKPQTDYHRWKATIFHTDNTLEKFVNNFIDSDEELAIFQIAGHTYDLDAEDMWDKIESIFNIISLQDNIISMTTIEIIDYLKAMGKAEITDTYITNNSEHSLWFSINGTICEVKSKNKFLFNISKCQD
ncbi:MAG: polysaccharide deacetylase family protein [Ruminococcus sp.]|nr:polysaccharide deacetylase family protein [Ruminococcus sp.]